MNAREARKNSKAYRDKLIRDNAAWRKKYDAEQARLFKKRKAERWDIVIAKIDKQIKELSLKGHREFGLEEILYFPGDDSILFEALMQHYKEEGFEVKEYQGFGLKLSW
jgi:hypothetical protein